MYQDMFLSYTYSLALISSMHSFYITLMPSSLLLNIMPIDQITPPNSNTSLQINLYSSLALDGPFLYAMTTGSISMTQVIYLEQLTLLIYHYLKHFNFNKMLDFFYLFSTKNLPFKYQTLQSEDLIPDHQTLNNFTWCQVLN